MEPDESLVIDFLFFRFDFKNMFNCNNFMFQTSDEKNVKNELVLYLAGKYCSWKKRTTDG